MKKIDGKKIAERIKDKLALEVYQVLEKEGGRRPNLAIILAGAREDSRLYVSLKEKVAKEVGIDTNLYLISEHEGEDELISLIEFLNQDSSIDGILVQLPLPERFNTDKILSKISPQKNVDGFDSHDKVFFSPLIKAIWYCLEETQEDLSKKKAFLFFNSPIFAEEVKKALSPMGIILDSISSQDFLEIKKDKKNFLDLKEKIKASSILISALGWPEFIEADFLKDEMIVIDIGITKKGKRVLGDVKFSDSENLVGYISPVPGGIGPITVVSLLENVFKAYQHGRKNFKN